VDLLFWLKRFNRQLVEHDAAVLVEVDNARALPLPDLRTVVGASAERVAVVTQAEAWK
jgi:hypothetical protein